MGNIIRSYLRADEDLQLVSSNVCTEIILCSAHTTESRIWTLRNLLLYFYSPYERYIGFLYHKLVKGTKQHPTHSCRLTAAHIQVHHPGAHFRTKHTVLSSLRL
ncbi:hypothetical protein KIL84_018716 [Mauremys mutica]|uniref:Uncharacterized protein n=1 Tax=Mauremys mutica TaxID=74926 RepID=A0A9D4B2P4_9SAUR|nr:hypothetical protein KIL84_018716 [Mauremys mutica]